MHSMRKVAPTDIQRTKHQLGHFRQGKQGEVAVFGMWILQQLRSSAFAFFRAHVKCFRSYLRLSTHGGTGNFSSSPKYLVSGSHPCSLWLKATSNCFSRTSASPTQKSGDTSVKTLGTWEHMEMSHRHPSDLDICWAVKKAVTTAGLKPTVCSSL